MLDSELSRTTALALYTVLRQSGGFHQRKTVLPIVLLCPSEDVVARYAPSAASGDYYAPRAAVLAWAEAVGRQRSAGPHPRPRST